MKAPALPAVLFSASSFAQEAPETMTRLEVALKGPGVAARSLAAGPKNMFPAGSRYCPIAEQQDTGNKIRGFMIINELVWTVNLWDTSARHGVDPAPSFHCKMLSFSNKVQP